VSEAASSEWPNSEERSVLPIPPAVTAEMAKGFTLYIVPLIAAREQTFREGRLGP
jgi:hypothetical protein